MIIRPPPKLTNRNTFIEYLEVGLWGWLKDLSTALLKLTFKENFQCFLASNVSIPAGQQVAISNQFNKVYPGVIPTMRIIVRQQGDANIIDGSNPWTPTQVYLYNPSANDAVVSVLFFK